MITVYLVKGDGAVKDLLPEVVDEDVTNDKVYGALSGDGNEARPWI